MKEKLKKNLKNIIGSIVFLAIAIGLLMSASYVLRPTESGTGRWRMAGFYGEEKNTIDVVAIGSSAMYRYFNNPYFWKKYNLTSYNLCTASQPAHIIGDLMDEAIREQSPQLFVVETRRFVKREYLKPPVQEEEAAVTEEDDGKLKNIELRRVTDNLVYSWNRFQMIEDQVEGDWQEKLDYHLDIIRYHGNWETTDYTRLRRYYDNTKDNLKKGWSNNFIVKPLEPLGELQNTEPLPIGADAEEELVKLLEKCKKEQINVVFVSTPWIASEEQRRRNIYLGDLIESYGFHFYDGNEHVDEMGLDYATDFYNAAHVNAWGSEKFTDTFGQYIMDNFDMDTEQEKHVTKSWNECVKANREEMKKRMTDGEATEEVEEEEVEEE